MKFRITRKPIFVLLAVLVSSLFLVGDTIYLPLVMGTGAAAADEVFIPAGSFQMGCYADHNDGYTCPANELPLHPVYLDDYYIDKYEVTNADYKVCVAAGDCTVPSNTTAYNDAGKANHPVEYVNWNQAKAYCEAPSRGGRLPTEAEWEKAARGDGYPRTFPWGEASADARWANYNQDVGDTTAVGSYPVGVSPYGAHDMAGNVWEWVSDWNQSDYYDDPAAVENPQGPASGDWKVRRGGGWGYNEYYLRVAFRGNVIPSYSSSSGGFRCARSP